jgi:hypothetical protein
MVAKSSRAITNSKDFVKTLRTASKVAGSHEDQISYMNAEPVMVAALGATLVAAGRPPSSLAFPEDSSLPSGCGRSPAFRGAPQKARYTRARIYIRQHCYAELSRVYFRV